MMAESTGAAWENPLIPNARLKQIYLAMVQVRTLARALPASSNSKSTAGLEACLTSSAIDLSPDDLVSDALTGGALDFLRGATLAKVLKPAKAAKKRGVTANCGSAAQLPRPSGSVERIWSALGAAAALKAETARTSAEARAAGSIPKQAGVVVIYALPNEVPTAFWRKALTFAREQELPVLFVVLPERTKGGKPLSPKLARVSALALGCGLPGIPVDADDAVAIYRVAQESIGHARIGGGTALMECVPFVVASTPGKRAPVADPIAGLEHYILHRRVATRAWMDREAKAFARRIAIAKAASK
jgi:TPP-dependent pyruvate/acetoin dehydrogenase alpha subunit